VEKRGASGDDAFASAVEAAADAGATSKPTIFVSHYPLDESIANWYVVLDKLKTIPTAAVLVGHGHRNTAIDFEGLQGVMSRSNLGTKEASPGYTVVDVGAKAQIHALIDQLAQLEATRDATDISLKELQNTLASYQAQLPQQETNLARVVGEASDTYIKQMQEQLSQLEVRRDMTVVDARTLAEAKVEDGSLVHGDLRWRVVVLPGVMTLLENASATI
jgi:hypothetical protein